MKKVVKKLKQSLSILLAVAMVITCVPQTATLAYAASDTDIIDTETSTEAETPAELDESEVSTDEPAIVLDDADDDPADETEQPDTVDETEQPDMADEDAAGEDMEVELTEEDAAQETDPVENDPDLNGGQTAPFAFTGTVIDGENGDVTFTANENVTINDTENSKGLTSDSGSEAYYFEAKANEGYKITEVTATAVVTGDSEDKEVTLTTKTSDAKMITTESVADDYTKYTIPLSDTALGDGLTYANLKALTITIKTEGIYSVSIFGDGSVDFVSGVMTAPAEDNFRSTTTGKEDIVFTVKPMQDTDKTIIKSVTYKVGNDGEEESLTKDENTDTYTISKDKISGDVEIRVTMVAKSKFTVSVKDYTDKATNHYEVYPVTKKEDGTYEKVNAAYDPNAEKPWSVEEGADVYFVVVAADMYLVKVSGAKTDGNLEDGTQIYKIIGVSEAKEIEVTVRLNTEAAYKADFITAEGADDHYTISTDSTGVDTHVIDGKNVRTALESINITVTPDTGYEIVEVKKVGDDAAETLKPEEGQTTVTIAQTFNDTNKEVKYEVTVKAKALAADGGTITFKKNADDLTLAVTASEDDGATVVPVKDNGEVVADKYQVKQGAQYLEFTLTTNNAKIVPVVNVDGKEWSWNSLKEEESTLTYEYKVSASIFTENTDKEVTITQTAVTKKLTVLTDERGIDLERLAVIVGTETLEADETGSAVFEGTECTDYKEYVLDIDSEVTLKVSANDEYKIASYQIGSAEPQEVNEKATEIELTLTDDTIVIINPVSAPTPYTVTLKQGDAAVEGTDNKYSVDYGKTYVATVNKGDYIQSLAEAKIAEENIGSTATVAVDAQSVAINVAAEDAGKKLTVNIWTEDDKTKEEPSVTFVLQVSKAITGATITGVKSKKLTQTVDTEQAYEIKVTPADADVNNLVADIKWAEGATEAEKAAFTAAVVDGRLVITTAIAKDADAASALNTAAQKATIRLADKTKGSIADGNYPDEAIVNGTDFKLTIAAPTGLTGVTPTVALKSSDDVSLTLTLGVPANKIAEPNLGKLWYEVTVTPDSSVSDNNIIKETTYYFAKKADANTQDEEIVVSAKDFGSGKGYKFNVTAKVVQTLNDFDLEDTTADGYETSKAAALTAFASKSKTLAAATKDPYFATKLTLKKGTTNVYTGMENIKIATIDFGKDTTYKNDDNINVTDLTTGYGINPITEFDVRDGNVYLSIPLNSNGSYSNVTLGKHTIRVTAQSPNETWAAYADLVITVNRGIERLSLVEASDMIYKADQKAATLKVTPVYNNGYTDANYAAKTKKVKDYVIVKAEKDEDGNDVVINDKNLTVKNGTVTVAKGFDLAAAKANGTDKFKVRATSADWTDKASGTSSNVYGYSGLITITEEPMVLGDVVVVKYDDNKNIVPIISKGKREATTGEFADAWVAVLNQGVEAKLTYEESDFVDPSYLTFKSSNAKALGIDSDRRITAVKTGKNIKITVSANDGSKASTTLDKIEIKPATPEALGLKVERVNVWGNEELNGDYADTNAINFTGTTNSVLQLTVMRKEENSNWYELDELTDLKVDIKGAKVLNKVSAYNQGYTVIANTAAATVKLTYTNSKPEKVQETFTINNNGVVTAAAPKLKASGNLVADYHKGAQTVVYTLDAKYINDYKGKVVMVNTDAADRNNVKNTSRYQLLEATGNVNGWTGISEDGTFELNFNNMDWGQDESSWYTYIPAGSYKLSFTFGTVGVDGSFIPDTKPVNMTLKAVAPKTVKLSYKPVTTVKMSVYDTAAGKVLTGTGKGFTSDTYDSLLNANITGQANNFRELFELDGNVLKLKSTFSDSLKAALKKAGEIDEETDDAVIEYITASKSKAAKNDRIGYANYTVYNRTAYGYDAEVISGQTKLTVTFDTKKSTDTYTLTNTTILQGTKDASVQVLKNKKAEAVIADAYVTGCDKDGVFEVSSVSRDAISFTLADATANTANKYKVTVAVVPANNYYAAGIAAKKAAWEAAKNAQSPVEADITAAKQEYVDAITDKGIKLTTTVTVGAKATTKNKISVAKNNLKPAFTSGYSYVDGVEAGYDGKHENYWIQVPYTKNMACVVVGIDSNDNKLAAAREDESQNLVSFGYGVQDWDPSRDDYNSNFISICLNKKEFEAAVEAGKVKYSEAKKKATLAVKATVHFGSKWVTDEEGNGGHWDTETVDGKDAVMTEVISFTLTLPSKPAANGYDAAVSAVEAAKDAIAAASVPESWIWNGEGLPLPDAQDGVITLNSNDVAKRDLLYTLNGLICNVREEVEKIASSDTNVVIRMPQECDNSTGVDIMTLKAGDFTAPTTTTAGTLKVRADLYDAATCDEENKPILDDDEENGIVKSTVTTVEFTLEIPKLVEKPADVKAAIEQFISEKENDSDYIAAITGQDVIERDARRAAELVDENGKLKNSLRLRVDNYYYYPASIGDDGYISGDIIVYGYRYGGQEISVPFSFTIKGLDSLAQTKTNVVNAVSALTATNATTKEEILKAANAAIKNPQFSAVWQKAGEGTLKDSNDDNKPVEDKDGDVYKLKAADRTAAGYVIGTIVIVDNEDETVSDANLVNVNLPIAQQADSTNAVNKVKAAVGFDSDGQADAAAIKALVLKYGNSEEKVKAGILEEANKVVKNDGYTVVYKKDTDDATKVLFKFEPVNYKATGSEGQEGYDSGKGSLEFTLEITDDQASEGATAIPDVVMAKQEFGPFADLQTLDQAKVDVEEALKTYKDTITDSTTGNAVLKSSIEGVVTPVVKGAGLTVAVEDFVKEEATVKAAGSITCKVVITKEVEDAENVSETINFEVVIPKKEQTLDNAAAEAEGVLKGMKITNDDIVTETSGEGDEETTKDVVKDDVLSAIISEVEKVIDTDSFTVSISYDDNEYVVKKATIKDDGTVKITVKITNKPAGNEGATTKKAFNEWKIKLEQSPEEAKEAANSTVQAYVTKNYADGITEADFETVAGEIKAQIESVVKTSVYTVEAKEEGGKTFVEKEADEEKPARYEATFILKYIPEGGSETTIPLDTVVINKKTTETPTSVDSSNSVSANDSER